MHDKFLTLPADYWPVRSFKVLKVPKVVLLWGVRKSHKASANFRCIRYFKGHVHRCGNEARELSIVEVTFEVGCRDPLVTFETKIVRHKGRAYESDQLCIVCYSFPEFFLEGLGLHAPEERAKVYLQGVSDSIASSENLLES